MKNLLYLFGILLFFSCCATQTIFDPVSKKEVKVYENDTFSFYYPKNWKTYKSKHIRKSRSILSLSPSDLIKTGYRYNGPVSMTHNVKWEEIKKPENEIKFAPVTISLYEVSLNDSLTYENYISERIEKFVSGKDRFLKQSDMRYIFYTTMQHPKADNIATIQHFIRKNTNTIQILSYRSDINNYAIFLEDAQMVFSSFEFKDQKTDLKSDLAPEKQLLLKEQ